MLIPFLTFYGRGRCCIACPVLCVFISLAPDNAFIQQSIVGFDEFMKVQAGRARHADVFVVISQKFQF